MLIFEALTVECVEFQLLTIDYMHIYGRMCSDSTPSLVYRVEMCIAAVTIKSAGRCHSHRLYSHGCDSRPKLGPALSGV